MIVVFFIGTISVLASHALALGDSKTQHLIDKICYKTEDYHFCNRVFNDNLVPGQHDMHGLARIALEQGTLHAVYTCLNVSASFSSETKNLVYKKYLKDCVDGYGYIKTAYIMAFGCFRMGLYKAEYEATRRAWRAEAMCEGYRRPHPLYHSNWEMRVLISMTLATAHELAAT